MVIGLTMGGTVAFYTFTSYMQILMLGTIKDKATVTTVNFFALLLFMLLQPVFGRSLLQMDGKEHARKRARPFASGAVPLLHGMAPLVGEHHGNDEAAVLLLQLGK